ncbi:MAG: toprim domain-containing protein [Patescibacteria group bacterium]|nr:toprim domain-containing protein [Patescibacteria group bacterium]
MPERIKTYLLGRGLTEEVITDFNLGWNGTHIVIPCAGFNKYRRDPEKSEGEKYLYDKGSKASLYGKEAPVVVLTEGEFDALALISRGIPAMTSTGGCRTFKDEWLPQFSDKEVFICFDTDAAGREAALALHFKMPTSKIVQLPSEVKDVTEFFQSGKTTEQFQKLMQLAMRFKKPQPKYIQPMAIGKGKETPITLFLKIPPSKQMKCLWHDDSNPSLHFYPDTNSLYCFGCGKRYDVIDVVMKLQSISFKEALSVLEN